MISAVRRIHYVHEDSLKLPIESGRILVVLTETIGLMDIQLNGETRTVSPSWTISDLLADLKIESRYCAVERNRCVVPREQHAQCQLQPDDQIEIVTLVGGG